MTLASAKSAREIFDQLPFGDGHLFHALGDIEVETEPRQPIGSLATQAAPVDEAALACRHLPHEEVLCHRQPGNEARVLGDDGDAGLLAAGRGHVLDDLSADGDRARIGWVQTGEDVHQRGLARAVLAHQGVDLALPDIE